MTLQKIKLLACGARVCSSDEVEVYRFVLADEGWQSVDRFTKKIFGRTNPDGVMIDYVVYLLFRTFWGRATLVSFALTCALFALSTGFWTTAAGKWVELALVCSFVVTILLGIVGAFLLLREAVREHGIRSLFGFVLTAVIVGGGMIWLWNWWLHS